MSHAAPTYKHLPAANGRGAALRFFAKRRFNALLSLWERIRPSGFDSETAARLPYAELVWMPYYLFTIAVKSPRGTGTMDFSVEGHSGAFALFQMHTNLEEGPIDGPVLPLKLSVEEAERAGRDQLIAAILRRRGHREKPTPQETRGVDLFYYPYWVYYYERRRGRIDLRLFDAALGQKGGNRTKTGILSALASASAARVHNLDKGED